jgi:hypothetical protein
MLFGFSTHNKGLICRFEWHITAVLHWQECASQRDQMKPKCYLKILHEALRAENDETKIQVSINCLRSVPAAQVSLHCRSLTSCQ